jgi:hypothetical protein
LCSHSHFLFIGFSKMNEGNELKEALERLERHTAQATVGRDLFLIFSYLQKHPYFFHGSQQITCTSLPHYLEWESSKIEKHLRCYVMKLHIEQVQFGVLSALQPSSFHAITRRAKGLGFLFPRWEYDLQLDRNNCDITGLNEWLKDLLSKVVVLVTREKQKLIKYEQLRLLLWKSVDDSSLTLTPTPTSTATMTTSPEDGMTQDIEESRVVENTADFSARIPSLSSVLTPLSSLWSSISTAVPFSLGLVSSFLSEETDTTSALSVDSTSTPITFVSIEEEEKDFPAIEQSEGVEEDLNSSFSSSPQVSSTAFSRQSSNDVNPPRGTISQISFGSDSSSNNDSSSSSEESSSSSSSDEFSSGSSESSTEETEGSDNSGEREKDHNNQPNHCLACSTTFRTQHRYWLHQRNQHHSVNHYPPFHPLIGYRVVAWEVAAAAIEENSVCCNCKTGRYVLLGEKNGPNVGGSLLWKCGSSCGYHWEMPVQPPRNSWGEFSVRMVEATKQVGLGFSKYQRFFNILEIPTIPKSEVSIVSCLLSFFLLIQR